ncbi:uncharacterized protein LOC120700670 [Panicum virgatum]|uniref:uncharacterized protein LOC120700670 n=1 Tax=Panicum virgatum TaxID=38727 RepID=UPI0019D696B5|nr:uncharacterized protein LOC120700670 [Panicum virgatum]
MTGNPRWFSSLTPVSTKEYITFEDNNKGKVVSKSVTKDEVFGLVRDLILRLKNERQYDPIRAIRSDNGTEFKNARFEASIVIMEGTFIHQGKYTKDVLKKFDMGEAKPLSTPMSTVTALDENEEGEPVDQKEYQSMIESLLYMTVTRPNIHFAVCLCARF